MKRYAFVIACLMMMLITLPACRARQQRPTTDAKMKAYDVDQDPNDAQKSVPLDYQQAQGKRVFYTHCVWCHADATPAGPSNRSNLTPAPPLLSDGTILNPLTDEFLQNVISLGGSAMGKSAMMPPWGQNLTPEDIHAVIAYIRIVAQPLYQPPARRGTE
jgi:mono/diheme cytochrome c family protein